MQILKIPFSLILIIFWSQLFSQYEWIKIYGDHSHYYSRSLIETYDNGYLISGNSYKSNGTDIDYGIIIKTDINGNTYMKGNFSYLAYFDDILLENSKKKGIYMKVN